MEKIELVEVEMIEMKESDKSDKTAFPQCRPLPEIAQYCADIFGGCLINP